jgi:hypothetical protein
MMSSAKYTKNNYGETVAHGNKVTNMLTYYSMGRLKHPSNFAQSRFPAMSLTNTLAYLFEKEMNELTSQLSRIRLPKSMALAT